MREAQTAGCNAPICFPLYPDQIRVFRQAASLRPFAKMHSRRDQTGKENKDQILFVLTSDEQMKRERQLV